MTNNIAPMLDVLKRVLDDTPATTTPTDKPLIHQIQCANCQGLIPVSEATIVTTSQTTAIDSVCVKCAPLFKGLAKIVCLTCRQVVACVQPHKDASGFEFKPGAYYHVAVCPTCTPTVASSALLEKKQYDQMIGRK
jgi:hypothetical protein